MYSQRWILCFIVQSKVSNPLLVSKGRGGLGKIPRAFSLQGRRVLTGLGRGPGSCILGIVLFVWRRRTGIWGSAFLFLLGDGIISTTVLSTLISAGVRLTPRTLDLEVRGPSLARRVVSSDKELYSTLPLFTQVHKWVPATYCWEVTLWCTSIPSRRRSNTPMHASCYWNRK